jgi:BirA family transcriptional regulator, biotin operon repressor / biotin---[acetyl-CoA-carboxylase] ligase
MSIREALLQAFEGRPGRVISGEALAGRLHISRVAVWKHINTLKDLGIPLESSQRSGYRLDVPADSSLMKFVPPKRVSVFPHYFLNTHSTQTLAKEGGMAGLPEGHFWIAETQSKGRGRLERVWESAFGGLWFSLLLRPKVPPTRIPPLTLLAGLCLRNAISRVCRLDVKLKWPNDVVFGSKKLAGILTEMSGQVDRTDWVVIGVGLNVQNTISRGLADLATSLFQVTQKAWKRGDILRAFFEEFWSAYRRFESQGFEPFQVQYWSHYGGRQKSVRLRTADGAISGIARGVDASGAIMIESRRKIHTISEGEIVN